MLSAIAFVYSRVCVCYESMNNSVVLPMHAFDLCSAFEVSLCICLRFLDVFFRCFFSCFLVSVSYVCSWFLADVL